MNIIKSIATASFATCAAIALSVATSSEAQARYRTITGDIAGFRDVTAVDREVIDTFYIPLHGDDGIVEVRCATGEYTWNYKMNQLSALRIKRAWCN